MRTISLRSRFIIRKSLTYRPQPLRKQCQRKSLWCTHYRSGSRQSTTTLAQQEWLAVKTMTSKYLLRFLRISLAQGRMLMPAQMISPIGNLMGNLTLQGGLGVSLQWMSVQSRSNTTVFLSKQIQCVLQYPFRRGRLILIFLHSSSVNFLLFSSIFSMLSEVLRCSLASDFSSIYALTNSDTQQTLCLGEYGLLLKVFSSACSGTWVTKPLRLIFFSFYSLGLLLLISKIFCFSSFFFCKFFFISVILCQIESNFSCNFLYSLLSMNCFFLGLPTLDSGDGLSMPFASLCVDLTFTSLMSILVCLPAFSFLKYFCEQELGKFLLPSLYFADNLFGNSACLLGSVYSVRRRYLAISGEFLRFTQSYFNCYLAFLARCSYSTSRVCAVRLIGEKV